MQTIIVVPTGEEQAKIRAGRDPDVANIFTREFATEAEVGSYVKGLDGLPDLMEYEIIKNKGLSVTIEFDGESSTLEFASTAEKEAYLSGLEDADGFNGPIHFREEDEEFDALKALIDSAHPRP